MRRLALLPLLGALAGTARAEHAAIDRSAPAAVPFSGARSAEAGMFLPSTLSARTGIQKSVVSVLSGYDTSRGAVLRASTEVNPWGPIVLQAGAIYSGLNGLQPRLGLRVQILKQARHRLDLAAGVQYDGASYEGKPGFEAFLAFSRQLGRLGLFANIVYGQETEPSQRHGEVRLAALGRAADALFFGLDGRVAFDLDTGREELDDDAVDVEFLVSAGPTASYSIKWFTVIAQGGPVVLRYKGAPTQVGALVLAGVGATLY